MTENFSLSDVAAVTRNGYDNGMFGGEWMMWIFALLMLNNNGGLFGNRNAEPVSEAGLCNAMNFNNLENAVGRQSDQINNVYTGLQNGLCQLGYETLRNFASLEQTISSCCCETKQLLMENRYLAERNAASVNETTVATGQKVLDAICGLRMEMKDAQTAQLMQRVNQLEMQQLMCGVVRYPQQTTYSTPCNPFFGGGYGSCNNYGCNNI